MCLYIMISMKIEVTLHIIYKYASIGFHISILLINKSFLNILVELFSCSNKHSIKSNFGLNKSFDELDTTHIMSLK